MAKTEKNNITNTYKWITIGATVILTAVTGTVTTLSFLKGTVEEAVANSVFKINKDLEKVKEDVKNLKEDFHERKEELADVKTELSNHRTSIKVLEFSVRNSIDKTFMKPEEPEVKPEKKK